MITEGIQNKITVLLLVDGMDAGGTERQVVELLKGIKRINSVKTVLGVLVKGGELQAEAESAADVILPVRQSSQYDFSLAYSLVNLARKYNTDIIHTFGAVSDFAGIVAGKINGIPVINGSIRNARPKLNKRDRISRFCMRFASWIVANSNAGLTAYGVASYASSSVIYNGVDPDRFVKVIPAVFPEKTICMVGNFSRKKDQQQLIEVLPELQKKHSELHLVLVGRGSNLKNLQNCTKDLGLQQSVTFVINCNTPEPIIRASCIGVLLSPEGEGLSNAIIEYMALGKPVIASDMGGNSELVSHDLTGYLVDNNSPEQLIAHITHLLDNPKHAMQMGMKGKQKIADDFTVSRMVDEYGKLYEKLVY